MVLEDPITGERIFVQVKSRASQQVLESYLQRFLANDECDRIVFACHSPDGPLSDGGRENVHIWTADRLAELAINTGLYDWLVEKCA